MSGIGFGLFLPLIVLRGLKVMLGIISIPESGEMELNGVSLG